MAPRMRMEAATPKPMLRLLVEGFDRFERAARVETWGIGMADIVGKSERKGIRSDAGSAMVDLSYIEVQRPYSNDTIVKAFE
jgi:hypothetical protein